MSTTNKRKREVEPAFSIVEAKEYEELLTCCICTELVFKRVFLKCGHSFCKKCLDQSKVCPKCRGCKEGARDLLSEFEKAIYAKILVECNQCEKQMNCQLAEKHKESCWRYSCKNKGCSDWVADQTRHDTMCTYKQVECGRTMCKWKGYKKDVEAHISLHWDFILKEAKLERELEASRQEFAVTVLNGYPKEQFMPLHNIPDCPPIDDAVFIGDQVKVTVWNKDINEWEELVVSKSDPRIVYSIEDKDQQQVEEMKVDVYWIPDREEPDPGSLLFS